jgi:hypothetical protein
VNRTADSSPPAWLRGGIPLPWLALFGLGLALYAGVFAIGFVGDDLLFLDAAVRFPLGELLTGRHGIIGFYRPLSRELYFWWWGRVIGLDALSFHVLNAVTFVAIVMLLARIANRFAGPRAGSLAALAYVVFPGCGALLAWISCAQDLIALFWTVLALVLYFEGRSVLAGVAVLAAALSKETAAVTPLFLAAAEWIRPSSEVRGERVRKLLPAVVGLGVAGAIAVWARSTWQAGTAVAVWSPSQASGAWKLPWLFVRSLFPPDWLEGLGKVGGTAPMLLVLVIAAAALAVPVLAPVARAPRAAKASRARDKMKAKPSASSPAASHDAPSSPTFDPRSLIVFGLILCVIGMLPVAFIVERWRSYFFGFAALGSSLALAGALCRASSVLARLVMAALALVHLGANAIYKPLPGIEGPARHPHANIAFFRQTSDATRPMLESLRSWCDSLRAVPKTFVAGIPPDAVYQSVFGAGVRAQCRDTSASIHFLAEFTKADAVRSFGIMRRDPRSGGFVFERANPENRARIGEGFLLYGRYDLAAACFETATAAAPDEPELAYPLACALAADRRPDAEARGRAAMSLPRVPAPAVFASRLVAAGQPLVPDRRDAALAQLTPLVAAAMSEPWRGEPHRALGRVLLQFERVRPAVFELATAAGITRKGLDLGWLGEGYEMMGATDEARNAYRTALSLGIEREYHNEIFRRFMKLGPTTAPNASTGQPPGFGSMPDKRP